MVDDCDWRICLSHYRRKKLNEKVQTRRASGRTDTVTIDCETEYEIFPGTKLVDPSSTHKPIVNGDLLRVTEVLPEVVKLKETDLDGEEFEVTVSQLARHTRLRQGLQLKQPQRTHELCTGGRQGHPRSAVRARKAE